MCLRSLELGRSAEERGAEVDGVELLSPCCCLEAEGTLSPLEARPGICKPVDWDNAGTKIAPVCAGMGHLQMLLGEHFGLNGPAEIKPS